MEAKDVTEQVRAIRQAMLEGHTYDIPAVKAACDKLDELAKAPASDPAAKSMFTPTSAPSFTAPTPDPLAPRTRAPSSFPSDG